MRQGAGPWAEPKEARLPEETLRPVRGSGRRGEGEGEGEGEEEEEEEEEGGEEEEEGGGSLQLLRVRVSPAPGPRPGAPPRCPALVPRPGAPPWCPALVLISFSLSMPTPFNRRQLAGLGALQILAPISSAAKNLSALSSHWQAWRGCAGVACSETSSPAAAS